MIFAPPATTCYTITMYRILSAILILLLFATSALASNSTYPEGYFTDLLHVIGKVVVLLGFVFGLPMLVVAGRRWWRKNINKEDKPY